MTTRLRRPVVVLTAIATGITAAAAGPAGAQGEPACPPGTPSGAVLRAADAENTGRGLIATHTISLTVETSDGVEIDEFELVLPPGAQPVRAGPSPAFRSDAPGPVHVVARWSYLGAGGPCTATTEGTFVMEPARTPRFVAPRRGRRGISELLWSLRVGAETDLRPVEVRLRGAQRARLPGPSAPVRTLALGLRPGDPNRMLLGSGRVLASAGWRFRIGPFFDGEFPIRMSKPGRPTRRGFGFELELVQGGVRIGRTRAVGRCEFTVVGPLCRARTTG